MRSVHQPVLLTEVLHYLNPKRNQQFIDATFGGGGHTAALLERIAPGGRVLGIDLDPLADVFANQFTAGQKKRLVLVEGNFKNIKRIAYDHNFTEVDGILLDLGLSSNQLQDRARGFSFLADAPLKMRFGNDGKLTAADIVNEWSEQELTDLFTAYGEERLAKNIAKRIVATRVSEPLTTTEQLVAIVAGVYAKRFRGHSKVNPATKVFQALRIAVNDELGNLAAAVPDAFELLKLGGRIAVISYHSLEDRIVKNVFREAAQAYRPAPETPSGRTAKRPTIKLVTKKPIVPTEAEQLQNPRSRSAKLRVAEKN
ncbi:MAG: 16S rRNA (cytosine(1402)-N(4))-methyltransferase [Candidatus Buchananbacteria bacterium RIFCSPHIGHO2_01_FULL_47_11b]|uniref:Ribosomal RNA small subunit methyltransferase H n=1 Tax=Candidatus Buchananbacteria bacterium RIFCSPHIGHO2_01_FULL_47_11b TaxID=1797537 RepID=A0A1G1Y5P5_9BACT|nr:MAG: 16S rRNA (cytosine(1402)-N(4))-methyltransferase [Candidatus Buchananbacteria bacterium RIFCSPHIGHO2_01_FULL_47_11b]